MKPRDFEKYLRKNPAPKLISAGFKWFVIIPVYDENEYIGRTLTSLSAVAGIDQVLVVLVVNHPKDAPLGRKVASVKLLSRLEQHEFPLPNLEYLVAFDLEGGVGKARKLGMDACLATLDPESVEQAVFWSLDADSIVARDYIVAVVEELKQHPEFSALSIGIRHQEGNTPELECAIRKYEQYLVHYVERLRSAGSPYAFLAIGSAFAVSSVAYLRAGGMRVRTGGEDFYFLQAVAKIGKVGVLERKLVYPSPRPSDRVPFGTGPMVRNLLVGGAVPEIPDAPFEELRNLLAEVSQTDALVDPNAFLARLSPAVRNFLLKEGFTKVWSQVLINIPPTPVARQTAFHQWFDGLKTLRLLHSLSH